eukprot:TRINITY_DN27262_c0_g1_i1.p1 TRINITY_DN27262_c0_g1~~TRINITY_DN27262_c0_g1_i1.p1  ORF type:complete len:806 (-),score=129.50 TRINITY_DN27262_c0_g1_i1:167-2383(-)
MFHANLEAAWSLPQAESRRLGVPSGDRLLYRLIVPGLHEGKPPVFRGDAVYIRPESCVTAEYCCCAISVVHSQLLIQVPQSATALLSERMRVHVRFSADMGRLGAMWGACQLLMRKGLGIWSWNGVVDCPSAPTRKCRIETEQSPSKPQGWQTGRWFGMLNEEQRLAVEALQTLPPESPPLLLLGPPGTGKSFAIAEAICQWIYQHMKEEAAEPPLQRMRSVDGEALEPPGLERLEPRQHILICAPTDIACDLLVQTVHSRFQSAGKELPSNLLLRFNEPRRPVQQLFAKQSVLTYSRLHQQTGCFRFPEKSELKQAVVVVCTLRAAWWLSATHTAYDYIVVDEAGQAMEIETYSALVLSAGRGKVMLAGDTKQLGPTSRAAQRAGGAPGNADILRRSLLQRLAEQHPRWKSPGSPWSIRLVRNYRSHPAILKLLSTTRYDGALLPCADPALVMKFEALDVLPVKGFPIVFIGVRGQQEMDMQNQNQYCLSRPDVAHSYHNPEEALAVLDFITKLLRPTLSESSQEQVQVVQDDIGVVCTFRRQVQKIRGMLRAQGFENVRVGTVEDYQGQEERILIISTTLSDASQAATLQELEPTEMSNPSSSSVPGANEILRREECAASLEACIRARLQKEEAANGSPWPLGAQRQTANLIGNVRRFTVAVSRAQCLLAVIGSPEVLETSPHWRRFLVHVSQHGACQGHQPSRALIDGAAKDDFLKCETWTPAIDLHTGGRESNP